MRDLTAYARYEGDDNNLDSKTIKIKDEVYNILVGSFSFEEGTYNLGGLDELLRDIVNGAEDYGYEKDEDWYKAILAVTKLCGFAAKNDLCNIVIVYY